jgi:hypothetical protein
MDRVIRKATEAKLSMDREEGFYLSKAWKPPICSLEKYRKPSSLTGL